MFFFVSLSGIVSDGDAALVRFHFRYCSMILFPKFKFNYFMTLIAVLIYKSTPFYSYGAMASVPQQWMHSSFLVKVMA